MKITSIEKEDNNRSTTFPCFMESIQNGRVILFFNFVCGVVVKSSNLINNAENNEVGYFSSTWINANNTTYWKPWMGSVTFVAS